ncbi:hypothetical protein MRS44_007175 [Fusarium solani]|uniref:uncharacterized protein n=1 Tax=Fusarium solani TaxID=169388 RepID=UPI0032C412C1|nr:hypothetical protein MRS44_007175 [Fusarium solani]
MSNRKAPEGLLPPIMQHHPMFNDSELVIWQTNLKNCGKRLKSLAHEVGTLHRPPDVIAVQDPPPDMPWNSIRSYEPFYDPERPVREEDRPQNRARGKPAVRLSHVCFFVHRSIPGDTYEVEYHKGANKDLAASLYLQTPNAGTLAIHNVYNSQNAVEIEVLIRDTTTTGRGLASSTRLLKHTAFHLFTQCERLRGPRAALAEKVGHNNFYRLLIEQPEAASDWAITHFDLNHGRAGQNLHSDGLAGIPIKTPSPSLGSSVEELALELLFLRLDEMPLGITIDGLFFNEQEAAKDNQIDPLEV